MKLNLRERLLTGFLSVALLLLLTGGAGIVLIDRVSKTTNLVLDNKKPLEENALRMLLSIERSIGLSRDYVLSFDEEHVELLLEQLGDENINLYSLVENMEYADSIAEHLTRVSALYEEFNGVKQHLIDIHDQRMAFRFQINGNTTDLKTFILQQRIERNDWLDALQLSAKINSSFKGNMKEEGSDYLRWHSGFESDDEELTKLLDGYAKTQRQLFGLANKVNSAQGEKKLSHYEWGSFMLVGSAKKGLDGIVKYVVPVVTGIERQEQAAVEALNLSAEKIHAAIYLLRDVIAQEVEQARQQMTETDEMAWSGLIGISVVGLVLAILIALYIARSVVNPVHQLVALMRSVSDEGDFSHRMENPPADEIGQMANTLNALLDSLQGAIGEIGEVMGAAADGNFSQRVRSSLKGDLNQLKRSINDSVERTQGAISRVNQVMEAVESGNFDLRIEEQFGGELHAFRNTVNGALDSLAQMTHSLSSVMDAIVSGEFEFRMEGTGGSTIEQKVNRAMQSMEQVISDVAEVMAFTAQGDLTHTIRGEYPGQLAALVRSINESLDNQREIVRKVRDGARAIQQGATEIAKGNDSLAQRTTEQSSSLEQTAASMEQMSSTVKMNADNAHLATELSETAMREAEHGGAVVNEAVRAMARINESSEKISDIISLIDGIAFQTNLLALNAAVEAARAGEQGRLCCGCRRGAYPGAALG
jgi:methyl-accepting chemotaxis protein